MTWAEEVARITEVASWHHLDPYLIMAIRRAERGGPGRQFGTLTTAAPSYDQQLDRCCNTVRNCLTTLTQQILLATPSHTSHLRCRYTTDALTYLAARYAPIAAANDPHFLNADWLTNVLNIYHHLIADGPAAPRWTDI